MKLKIPRLYWLCLVLKLRERGENRRESGAFLLARSGTNKLVWFICYDTLDPHCLDKGYITFDCKYHVPLLKYCRTHNLQVVADVHTHPGGWTEQSDMDKENPMFSVKGYMELIMPRYGYCSLFHAGGVGAFEYEGDNRWSANKANEMITFTTI
jgi:proteasome lid subunit RPN8/RPN11